MARHRATRPSIASVISTTSTNGTRTRTKLSYEQNALLALAENSLKKNKKPLNVSAIVKAAERRAHEQGLELGVRARPGIKKAVEKLTERGAIAEAPRKGRSPAEYRLTPKAVKIFNDAKSHRRSDIGIAKETIEVLKGDAERPSKRRRSSVLTTVASPTRPAQQVTIAKLKAELAAARSEIESLKKSNNDLLDQQLDDGDDDIFDSPVRNANARKDTDLATRPLLAPPHSVSFLGSRPTRPTTPEPTENGSPEYDAPGEFDFTMAIPREMTPSFSLDAGGTRGTQEEQIVPEKSELELKIERLEAAMSELVLEKTQMAEEIVALKNQVEHERQSVTHLTQVQHEADLVRVELAQVSKDRDSAVKDVSFLTQDNAALERRCVEVVTAKQQLELTISQLNADIEARITAEAEVRASLADTTQELGVTKQLLALAQDETLRLSETLDMEYGTTALLTSNLSARESTIADLQATASLTENQLQTLRGEATALRESLASAEERALRTELVVQERDAQILGLKAEEEALRLTIEGLQGQNNDLLCERAERISQLDAMKAKAERDLTNIQDLDKAIEGLNAQVDALRDDLDGALAHSDQLRAKAEEDSAAAGRLIAERDITIAERDVHLAKLGRNLHNQVQQLGESQARVNQLEAALAASTRTAESLKSSRETLEGELASAADTIVELSNKIDSLEANDQVNAKYIAELKLDLDRHKRSIEEHQDLISKLELQLQRLRDIELGRLRKRQARIKAEAERLREEEDELTRETIDVDQWDEGLTQSRAARSSLAPSWTAPSSP